MFIVVEEDEDEGEDDDDDVDGMFVGSLFVVLLPMIEEVVVG